MTETLQEWLRAQCNRYVNGACTTARCLRRGGWVPGGPQSADDATCEAHEAAAALDAKDAEIAAAHREMNMRNEAIRELSTRLASAEAALRWIQGVPPVMECVTDVPFDMREKARAHFAKWEKPDAR